MHCAFLAGFLRAIQIAVQTLPVFDDVKTEQLISVVQLHIKTWSKFSDLTDVDDQSAVAESCSDAEKVVALGRIGNSKSYHRGSQNRKQVKCFGCGGFGHIRRYCPFMSKTRIGSPEMFFSKSPKFQKRCAGCHGQGRW